MKINQINLFGKETQIGKIEKPSKTAEEIALCSCVYVLNHYVRRCLNE